MKDKNKIFKKGSTTYYYSNMFFPEKVRGEVATLYAFVRVADDYVDEIPQQGKEFYKFRKDFESAWQGKAIENNIINDFVDLAKQKEFDKSWIDAFLDSMQADLEDNEYLNINDTIAYMHGSAEAIGYFMAKIMDLPEESHSSAVMLGRAMQFINFIRDIEEDNSLGRRYIPAKDLMKFSLKSLKRDYIKENYEQFTQLVRFEIDRYREWQEEGERGFVYIPARYLVPIKTASDMYRWTANKIYDNPSLIFQRKVKPNKYFILFAGIKNMLYIPFRYTKNLVPINMI